MAQPTRDPGLDDLLLLDGVTLVVDPLTNYWAKFVVKHVRVRSKVMQSGGRFS
jgi:hypothetical protein